MNRDDDGRSLPVYILTAVLLGTPCAVPGLDTLPPCGMGLGGISYYSTYSPFTDALKSARWINVASWDENGYPASAQPGTRATARMGVDNGDTWPAGAYTLTWEGSGEVVLDRPGDAALLREDLSSKVKKRVYRCTVKKYGLQIRIGKLPATDIHLYLPGHDENTSSLWNPDYKKYLKPFVGGPLRFMDVNGTNHSKQKEWRDRTPRSWSSYANSNNPKNCADWPVRGNASYESMIELCNETGCDLWINIPHMATDEYVRNLAHLVTTGRDRATGGKTTGPLKKNLRVWLELSNEVWNWNFAQSNWVNDPANVGDIGANLDERYSRYAMRKFKAFASVFSDPARVVRVLGTQTGYRARAGRRLAAVDRSEYDVLAITHYFSLGIQQWIYDNRRNATPEDALDELMRRMGTGVFREHDSHTRTENAFFAFKAAREFDVPVVSYEGGDHINAVAQVDTNGDGTRDTRLNAAWPGSVDFVHEMCRHSRMKKAYMQYLDRYVRSGLKTAVPFVLCNGWSKYGQWGHLEYLGQPIEKAQEYSAVLDYYRLSRPDRGATAALAPPPAGSPFPSIREASRNHGVVRHITPDGRLLRRPLLPVYRGLATPVMPGVYFRQSGRTASPCLRMR